MAKLTCYVTGANGYVGNSLCKSLQSAGYRVVRLVRDPSKCKDGDEAVAYQLGDALPEISHAKDACIVHCAYDFSCIDRDALFKCNVEGSIRLFEDARRQSINRFVFISSISAYDDCKSIYGQAKLSVEQAVRKLGGVTIRPGIVYGGDKAGGMVASLKKVAAKLPLIPVPGASKPLYLCHEEDLGKLVCRAVGGQIAITEPVIAACPKPVSFANVLRILAAKERKRPLLIPIPWQLAWCPLKLTEAVGIQLGFRSDSLVSLLNPNPRPDFRSAEPSGVEFRPFDLTSLTATRPTAERSRS